MEKEKRLIDANILESWIDGGIQGAEEGNGNAPIVRLYDVLIELDNIPTVDAVEVVHGRWDETEEEVWHLYKRWSITRFRCSQCKQTGNKKSNYCPNCGAKMDGDGNG